MSYKKIFLSFSIVILLFLSYSYLKPIEHGFTPLNHNHYNLKTYNLESSNKWAKFKDENHGSFFIHPGEEKASVGLFEFIVEEKLLLNFSIRNAYKKGKIEFSLKKNAKIIDRFIVTSKKPKQILLDVQSGDKIEISADKYGSTSFDWGDLQISVLQTSLFSEILIPLLWSIFFIFLFYKNYLFIALNSYIIFVIVAIAQKLNFGILNIDMLLNYTLLLFLLTLFFIFIYQKLKIAPIISFIVSFILYSIPLLFIIYALNFDTQITKDILYAVFQSNSGESYEYISDFIDVKYIFITLIIISASALLLYLQKITKAKKINNIYLLIIFFILLANISFTQLSELSLAKFISESFIKYNKELRLFKEVQEKRKTQEIKFNATKNSKGETYIVIIGESLNKKHMGVYGYFRDTTPNLSQMQADKGLIVFENVYSNHTHTVPVLSLSLTEANQYNKKTYYNSLSIIEILNKADIETYWLSNQVLYGGWDNMVSVIGTTADTIVSLNSSIGHTIDFQKLDGSLINEVKKVLAKESEKNRVIFVHLIGNHSSYKTKYPKEHYSKYTGKLQRSEFGLKASQNSKINHYDNSIVYNDYVVSSILKELQKEKRVDGFLYMSDHADDVIRDYGHSIDRFTYEMTQIPMIAWFSEKYKKLYSEKYNNLLNNREKLYSNDMFYDTLIGIFDIKTDHYNAKYDFSSKNYILKDKDALLIHGKKKYNEHENYIYWQKYNIDYLIDTNQTLRVMPHTLSSTAKEKEILNSGFVKHEKNLPDSYLISINNYQDKNLLATEIAKQIIIKNISAISFDYKIYTFVKDYLETKIPDEITYYVKSDLSLKDVDFKSKLLNNKIYLDKRVQIFLVDYESQFE